jgi:hypothetical protein
MLVLGMLLIILGLIADQISQLRLSQLPQMQMAKRVSNTATTLLGRASDAE